ncbi:MAG: TIGR00159 family protein [Flavobacteriales bacterium]|nr:TIGR00159 family protein [Flavobacteriales bacterium]
MGFLNISSSLLFISVRWFDFLDIILVALLLFQLYKLVKGTVAIRIFLGILAIYLLWKLVSAMQMEMLSEILGQFIGVGVLALIIVFQQEIRRFLLMVGSQSNFARKGIISKILIWTKQEEQKVELNINAIVKACFNMSKTKTGALIIIATDSELRYHTSTGVEIDAKLSSVFLESIFFKNSPLHDGGVIIHDNRIKAARCILPVSDNPDIPSNLGLRHRAAIGLTENSPAIAIIVSEETGGISFCKNSTIISDLSMEELRETIGKTLT